MVCFTGHAFAKFLPGIPPEHVVLKNFLIMKNQWANTALESMPPAIIVRSRKRPGMRRQAKRDAAVDGQWSFKLQLTFQ
jgi:hypothetical protein